MTYQHDPAGRMTRINISKSKRDSIAQDRRVADLIRHAVPGWHVELGPERLVADATRLARC